MQGQLNNCFALCSLTEWSIQHIRDIFEAPSDEDALRSIASTFSDAVVATLNGAPLSRDGITQLVITMRAGSASGLRVHWKQAVEVPRDPSTNRVSSVPRTHSPQTLTLFTVS